MYRFTRRVPMLALVVAVAACDDTPSETPTGPQMDVVTGWERTALDVYSQNLYLGGDTGPLFDPSVVGDITKLLPAVGTFWADVQASDVPGRMAAIADRIAEQNPELVGVQEALQFVTLDGSFQPDGGAFIDLLGALQAAIAAEGLPYDVVVAQPATSSALPLAVDFTTGQVTQYLGFTDRVVILKRSDVVVTDTDSGVYGAAIPITPQVQIRRAWARATVNHEGEAYHFVNTHLETQRVRPVHDLQAAELMAITSSLDGVTVLVGDLNSDAEGVEGDPSWTPTYGDLIAAGFADVWELAPHSRTDPGLTCCVADLSDATFDRDQRLDFVLVRSADDPIPGPGSERGHFRSDVIGDRPADRTDSGLWASDHAGIVGSVLFD
jgi:endonuclease/exonuclease/phosphatase family metal-dependent hydrolase